MSVPSPQASRSSPSSCHRICSHPHTQLRHRAAAIHIHERQLRAVDDVQDYVPQFWDLALEFLHYSVQYEPTSSFDFRGANSLALKRLSDGESSDFVEKVVSVREGENDRSIVLHRKLHVNARHRILRMKVKVQCHLSGISSRCPVSEPSHNDFASKAVVSLAERALSLCSRQYLTVFSS